MPFSRSKLLPEPELPGAKCLLQRGSTLAQDWRIGPSTFLDHVGTANEIDFKRRQIDAGQVMQHAQVGFRDPAKTSRAWREIYERCQARNVTVDRYGICLDWSMGYPRQMRDDKVRGTGLILDDIEGFISLTKGAPVAPHFGDFVLGFPAAVENTQAALAAGATAIGNLGQYFTFRLPGWDDDVASTAATVEALALIAAQNEEILVHSNLDDGYAALFADLASSLGAVLIEKYIVEDLIGAALSHCYGHHFTDPLRRAAFQIALTRVSDTPGTMIYGNTVSYTGGDAENYASLSAYLLTDIHGQIHAPSGHAVNPVPVRENERIPDIEEIVDAQLFAARMIEHAATYGPLLDLGPAEAMADDIVRGGVAFKDRTLAGLAEAGIDTKDAVEMLLALRRLGGRRLEQLFGAGSQDDPPNPHRLPLVPSPVLEEVEEMAKARLSHVDDALRSKAQAANLQVLVATTDVHEHGKLVLERLFENVGIKALDGGVSIDADDLVVLAVSSGADAIAVSTYNGIALSYIESVFAELSKRGLEVPVLVGGRLNQIPPGSNTSLPVDVTEELRATGALVCTNAEDAIAATLSACAPPPQR
jgi:methylmalonyl-CoA mutase cobalamin-binding subunit